MKVDAAHAQSPAEKLGTPALVITSVRFIASGPSGTKITCSNTDEPNRQILHTAL